MMIKRVVSRARNILRSFGRKDSFGLDGLDVKLSRYLKKKRRFFIETGANDGISQSNTLYFERYRGWKGLLIEPIPDLYEKCKRNRPGAIVENAALVPFDYTKPTISMTYCHLMSVVEGGMKTREEERSHVQKGCAIQKIESYQITVPARTLTSILDQHSVGDIGLLSLDVEGYELNVLKGLDFERYRPEFMLIEARYRPEIDSFLSGLYDPIAELSHHDVLYRRKG